MTPLITKPLSKAEAAAIFAENAVFHEGNDAIEIHRIVELFGEPIARFIEEAYLYTGTMEILIDIRVSGTGGEDAILHYCYFSGFLKAVSQHNHLLQVISHRQSEGGAVWDRIAAEYSKRVEAEVQKEARRQRRRKKKDDNADTTQ